MNTNQGKTEVVEVGTATFESRVLRAKQPVLVAFWAPWSRPCLVLDATLEEAAAACAGELKVVKVNADDHPDLSLCYDVQFIPTLLFFVDGQVRGSIVGTCSKEAIVSKLRAASEGSTGSMETHR
jgi:thioredoxin